MEKIFTFLGELARNNNREWFTENKKVYQEALDLFREFAAELLTEITKFDPTLAGQDAKDSIFRIYKDVRFSKDKTPYKTHFGCWMTKGGRKSTDAGYYFHLEPGNSFMAAGVHSPPKEQLNLIRQEILYNPDAYLELINDPVLVKGYERAGKDDMLKKGPVGYPKDFEYLEELKYKHYVYSRSYSDKQVVEKNFIQTLAGDYKGLVPLVNYLNHSISFTGNE
jgi:uncharacterized protein (TIGR02453 family)